MVVRITIFDAQAAREARRISTDDRADIAREAADEARAHAPVLTGDYRDGIDVEVDGDRVYLVDNDELALHKEYGTSDTPAHAALTDAARSRGRYSGWKPK
ncbi:HK97 gp10 family phage protein [Rhodococcus marinonascens]|uniref:HK97 gp10 family phage protein n=1 Tax=Rhodococcus marinonascens TaxID=38311 RepID=UPI000934B8C1|nr:HK97 gp10 family phage protein [Rhodococcus marinonascens]